MFLDILVKSVFILLLFFQLSSSLFENCNYAYTVDSRGMYLNSPNYGKNYPSGSSCQYVIQGPVDSQLKINCSLYMPTSPYTQSGCGTEFFFINLDGNSRYPVTESAFFCGLRNVVGTTYFNTVRIAYNSSGGGSGRFSCLIQPVPQSSCDCGWTISAKITNGIETRINEYPLMAGLVYNKTSKIFCGATIISHRYLMSAAHCFSLYNDPAEIIASVGEHDVTKQYETYYNYTVGIQAIIRHFAYDSSNQRNDIALLRTVTDILWSGGVGPACLPFRQMKTFANDLVDIIGWGSTDFGYPPSNFLRKATVYVIENSKCAEVMKDLNLGQICTYWPPKDACSFDSGGPVVYKNLRSYSIGITSFGIGCGINQPSVNTRVTYYLPWIKSVTPEVAYCEI